MMTQEEDIAKAADTVRNGGVVVYPTDTVWGLGCDATNPRAVARLYAIKRRADSKAMLTLMTEEMTDIYLPSLPPQCRETLLESERPTTVICPQSQGLAPALIAADGSVGVRLTREAFSQELCRQAGVPVVSTSVNLSGEPAPAIFAEIAPELLDAADYVAATRRDDTTKNRPSRIVAFSPDGEMKVIRP